MSTYPNPRRQPRAAAPSAKVTGLHYSGLLLSGLLLSNLLFAGQAIASESAGAVIDAYYEAYRSGEPAKVAEVYADDIVFVDVSQRHEVKGKEAMHASMVTLAAMHEAMGVEEKRRAVRGDLVIVEVIYTGTLDAAALGRSGGDGLTYSLPAVLLFEVENGRIHHQTDYLDFRTLSELMALAPTPTTPGH
ncbi:MAG: nuclear transport factor 2 family protein [Acidobacteriota bacterium]